MLLGNELVTATTPTPFMDLIAHRHYRGPNLFFPQSGAMLRVRGVASETAFWAWMPNLVEARQLTSLLCRIYPAAGDSEALREAVQVADAALPVAELLLLTASGVMYDFCVRPARGRVIRVRDDELTLFLPGEHADVTLGAWNLAARLPELWLAPADGPERAECLRRLTAGYRDFRLAGQRLGMNQTTLALARTAWARGIPHQPLSVAGQGLQLGQGRARQRVFETVTERTGSVARMLAGDKLATTTILSAAGIPTPGSTLVADEDGAARTAQALGFPVVVKPRSSGKGKGVSVKLGGDPAVRAACRVALTYGPGVLVERFVRGDDHRALVVAGRLVAVAQRRPGAVVGDGVQTVGALVEVLNRDPRRGLPFERLLEFLVIDDEARRLMAEQGLQEDSIPEAGYEVVLRGGANISRGGTAIDVTDRVHPDNRAMLERAARLVGLDVTGIDFITPDIGRSWRELPGAVLEVNPSPGLRPHLVSNPRRDVLGPIVEHLFPAGSEGRVPTVGVTGSLGKTTTCRMIAHILSAGGATVALSTTQGAWIGDARVREGDSAGGGVASSLLLDPIVDAGVFELARGALVRNGMVLDGCDVGMVLNVHDNHVGLDGIGSREELARVKRLVVVHSRQLAVLNADDPLCLAMRRHVTAPRLCLASSSAANAALREHVMGGGLAAWIEDRDSESHLLLQEGNALIGKIVLREIPATLGGKFPPAAIAAMFASAAAIGLGVDFAQVSEALRGFDSTVTRNPGRMNFVPGLPFELLINWTDGPAAVQETARYVAQRPVVGRKTLVLTSVGNRPDAFTRHSARAAAGAFSNYVCADAQDLRDRPRGEVALILAEALGASGVADDAISVIPEHDEAIRTALSRAQAGDLVVVLTYTGERVWTLARALADR